MGCIRKKHISEDEIVSEFLINWYKTNEVEKRIVEYFWQCFENYKRDETEEYNTIFINGKEMLVFI